MENTPQVQDQHQLETEEQDSAEAKNYLTFLASGDIYGIDIIRIKEILEFTSVTQVPMTPTYISGVINLRGNVVPVIDLADRLGKTSGVITKKTCILIVEVTVDEAVMDIGMTVDSVNKVLSIADADHEPPPAFGVKIRADFIRHMGRIDKQFIILLDIDKVLDIDELSKFDDNSLPMARHAGRDKTQQTMTLEQH